MNKHLLTTALASLVIASSSSAAIVISLTQSPTLPPQLFTSVGSSVVVPDGSLIRIGSFFDAGGNALVPNPNSTFLDYASSFREFARTTVGHTNASGANSGRVNRSNIAGSSDPVTSPAPDSDFGNRQLYIWVYSDADGDTTGTENQGVFAATGELFLDQAQPNSVSMTVMATAYGVLAVPGAVPASVESNGNTLARLNLSSAPIPEPTSTATIGLLAALGLLRRRR